MLLKYNKINKNKVQQQQQQRGYIDDDALLGINARRLVAFIEHAVVVAVLFCT